MILFLLSVLLVPALTGGARVAAQGPEPVRVHVVVTDRAGRPVADLGVPDFQVKADGIAQQPASVQLHSRAPGGSVRTFALFLDEFHVTPGNTPRVRDALLRFVDEHLRPDDRVIVMKPLDSQQAIRFAKDRDEVRAAVGSFSGRGGDYTPRSAFETEYLGHAPAAVRAGRAQIVTAAVRALAVRLGELSSGRSALALVTEGFSTAAAQQRERRLPELQATARVAGRFNVAVYVLDPASAEERGPRGDITSRLETIARETGGESASGDRLGDALQRMAAGLDTYYVLTFQPKQEGEGRFQRLDITTNRRGAVVHAPAGYWSPLRPALTRADNSPARPPRVVRRSPLIQTWVGLTRMTDGRIRLRITWEPAPRLSSRSPHPHAVTVHASRAGVEPLFDGRVAPVTRTSGDGELPHLAEFIVTPGRVELDLAIAGADGKTLDTDTRDIDVPDSGALRFASMSPEVVRARTVREFHAVSVDPDAAPTPLREFRRADRLLVRAAAVRADGSKADVTARLLNRWGQPMRDLTVLPGAADAVVQFDLPLAWLAPGEYEIELKTADATGPTAQRILLKITG